MASRALPGSNAQPTKSTPNGTASCRLGVSSVHSRAWRSLLRPEKCYSARLVSAEGLMHRTFRFERALEVAGRASLALLGAAAVSGLLFLRPMKVTAKQETPSSSAGVDAALLDGYRHVEVASVSDALEQLTGKRMYMTHRMRPIFPTRFAGRAVTVLLKKEANHDREALQGMLQAIDSGAPNSVYVMVVEDGADIAGMGGLMGTAMSARNFSGAVIDGGVRDTAYLQKIA